MKFHAGIFCILNASWIHAAVGKSVFCVVFTFLPTLYYYFPFSYVIEFGIRLIIKFPRTYGKNKGIKESHCYEM